ncbi:MAG TPA: hypothetical protein VG323_06000 [Thermoanaerobaculia bacterium]|nr:hypothetical protein [Thermoanaerobaculia bacterium]
MLATGDPTKGPASFTRFVLPFVWSLEETTADSSASYDVYTIPHLADRRSFFTPETADVLFSRASWLALPENAAAELPLQIGDREITAAIAPPRVVLFEAAGNRRSHPILSTGFLLLDLTFPHAGVTLDDLLVINELFRYWRPPFEGHASKERTTPDGNITYERFAANSGPDPYLSRWRQRLFLPAKTDKGVRQLAPRGDAGWIAHTDERAFVWTCALTERGANGEEEQATWIRLLNVDLPSAAAPTAFEQQWAQSRTYERWKHSGTLYGFNSHGGAMLGKPCNEPPTWQHFSELYFDQVLLLLYLRVSTFRFSRELSRVSVHLQEASGGTGGFKAFRELRGSFAFLTNLYRFPLLSSQQQGIEMYACARKALDVDELFEEVQKEIESTHEFFDMATAATLARTTTVLTYVAAFAAVVGLLLGTDAKKPLIAYLKGIPRIEPEWIVILIAGAVLAVVPLLIRLWRRIRMP